LAVSAKRIAETKPKLNGWNANYAKLVKKSQGYAGNSVQIIRTDVGAVFGGDSRPEALPDGIMS
jgi:hypothetical protein